METLARGSSSLFPGHYRKSKQRTPPPPRHLPHSKLVPLLLSRRPWSHIGVDFITDLPRSDSYNCVPVVVDWFSKACTFIPLPGPPTSMKKLQTSFRNFGIPEDWGVSSEFLPPKLARLEPLPPMGRVRT